MAHRTARRPSPHTGRRTELGETGNAPAPMEGQNPDDSPVALAIMRVRTTGATKAIAPSSWRWLLPASTSHVAAPGQVAAVAAKEASRSPAGHDRFWAIPGASLWTIGLGRLRKASARAVPHRPAKAQVRGRRDRLLSVAGARAFTLRCASRPGEARDPIRGKSQARAVPRDRPPGASSHGGSANSERICRGRLSDSSLAGPELRCRCSSA
jgi:hypothetical protein